MVKVPITVTAEDIAKGTHVSPWDCMCHRAISRALPHCRVTVAVNFASLRLKGQQQRWVVVELPEAVAKKITRGIVAQRRGSKVSLPKPFSFELEVPEQFVPVAVYDPAGVLA